VAGTVAERAIVNALDRFECLRLDLVNLAWTVTRSPGVNGLLGRKLAPVAEA
jgi:hypothetical protein